MLLANTIVVYLGVCTIGSLFSTYLDEPLPLWPLEERLPAHDVLDLAHDEVEHHGALLHVHQPLVLRLRHRLACLGRVVYLEEAVSDSKDIKFCGLAGASKGSLRPTSFSISHSLCGQ